MVESWFSACLRDLDFSVVHKKGFLMRLLLHLLDLYQANRGVDTNKS